MDGVVRLDEVGDISTRNVKRGEDHRNQDKEKNEDLGPASVDDDKFHTGPEVDDGQGHEREEQVIG